MLEILSANKKRIDDLAKNKCRLRKMSSSSKMLNEIHTSVFWEVNSDFYVLF